MVLCGGVHVVGFLGGSRREGCVACTEVLALGGCGVNLV